MFHERTVLTKGLIRARQAFMQGDQSVWKTIQMLENQLKTLSRREMEGVKIRSRAIWIEEGEKPMRFFFQREKSRIEKNQINLIFDKNNKEVTTKKNIEQAHTDFYTNLYSKGHIDLQAQSALLSTVNALPKGKTPGPDGLPLEFYIKFWSLLGPQLNEVINESFRENELSDSMKESVTRLIF